MRALNNMVLPSSLVVFISKVSRTLSQVSCGRASHDQETQTLG